MKNGKKFFKNLFLLSRTNKWKSYLPIYTLVLFFSSSLHAQESPYRYWPEYQKTPIENCRPPLWNAENGISKGWDFSLPPSVQVKSNSYLIFSRIFSLQTEPNLPVVAIKANPVLSIWIPWKELEPEEEVYRFYLLKSIIEKAALKGYGVELRPLTAVASRKGDLSKGLSPAYLEKYNIPIQSDPKKCDGVGHYDPMHPDFHKRYLKLVKEFANSGLAQHPTVKSIVVGYASPSFGDEGIGPHGMDPFNEINIVKERLDAWAEACSIGLWGWSHSSSAARPCFQAGA